MLRRLSVGGAYAEKTIGGRALCWEDYRWAGPMLRRLSVGVAYAMSCSGGVFMQTTGAR